MRFYPKNDLSFKPYHNKLINNPEGLSKKALNMDLGIGHFSETMDGLIIGEGFFSLF